MLCPVFSTVCAFFNRPYVCQAIFIRGIPAEHTAHGVRYETTNVTRKVSATHSYVFVLYFGGEFVLQTVDVDENAV